MEGADFSGYATKAGLKCTDGRTIMPDAFKHMDGMQIPLVWQHGHTNPENVLGHAVLEARPDGMYAHGFFNETPWGQQAKAIVRHKDVRSLSIFANGLVERAKQVLHGVIREVSLVLSGANPGALIDYIRLEHSDGEYTTLDDEAIIHTGLELLHWGLQEEKDEVEGSFEHATVKEIYEGMSQEEKDVVHYMIGAALEGNGEMEQSATTAETEEENNEGAITHQEGAVGMTRNLFEQNGATGVVAGAPASQHVLTHDAMRGIFQDAQKTGSLKAAFEGYALQHGIENIESLFPDYRTEGDTPEWDKRRTEWVAGVINGTRKSPFSRVKTMWATLTFEAARAKGYVTGAFKKEEFFEVSKRTTGPTTIYKKQKLDRDDILDITDFDSVAWVKGEMRMMLEEELARAILIGDGRDVSDEDKIKDPVGAVDGLGIRSIANDHELYTATVNVELSAAPTAAEWYGLVEAILRSRKLYKGTGTPTFYTTEHVLTELLLLRDGFDRRRFRTVEELANELRVAAVVPVEVMEEEPYANLIGVIVNLTDYRIGADKGGETTFFDDFDIDYNQYKYLYETRLSGALTKLRSALVLKKVASSSNLIVPTTPTFVAATGVVTIPTQTGTIYKNADTDATLTAGAQTALDPGESLNVRAVADTGYHYANNIDDEWRFTRPAA